MLLERCPKCDGKIAPSDTHCLDCGEDLVAHREELRKSATQRKQLTAKEKIEIAQRAAKAAARGRAFGVESSDETRLRTFDKHEAEKTKQELLTAVATAAIALILGVILLKVGLDKFKANGGVGGWQKLSMAGLRHTDVVFGETFLGIVVLGLALSSLLCAIGQTFRAVIAQRSIRAVERGEKPEVVYIHSATRFGMTLASVFCPPGGFICGLMMRLFGRDEDTKSLGGTMLLASVAVVVILLVNFLWGFASALKPAPEKTAPGGKTSAVIDLARQLI
jgi:hypothetical protein